MMLHRLPFEQLVNELRPMMTRILQRAHIYKDFDEFLHVMMIALWKAQQRYEPEVGLFSTFAYASMHGAIKDELNKIRRQKVLFIDNENEALLREEPYDPIAYRQLIDSIQSALSMEEYILFYYRYEQQFAIREIATLLQLPYEVVKRRCARMRTKVHALLMATNQKQ